MNILFVLSQVELTGAETYAVSLVQWLQDKGYKVTMVSDTLNSKIAIPYYSLDLDNRKSLLNRIKHVMSLTRIIRQEKITLLHAHSRASSWVAYFASRITNVPLVTTAHCIYSTRLSRKLMPCFGEKIIAISEAVREHLIRDLGVNDKNIFLIPNGINIDRFSPQTASAKLRKELRIQPGARVVSWVGRFSNKRGKLIEEIVKRVLPEILMVIPNLKILIIAGGEKSDSLKTSVEAINRQFNDEVIRFTGLRHDMPLIYGLSDLVIGAGRVALEAMACSRAVMAIGEKKFIGLLTPQNIEEGISTNFGDCCQMQPVDWKAMSQAIIKVFKKEDQVKELCRWGREIVISKFNLNMVAEKVVAVYDELQKK